MRPLTGLPCLALLVSLCLATPACAQEQAQPAPPAAPSRGVSVSGPIPGPPLRYLPAPPKSLGLCGEPVPLEDREVAEMLEREFTLMVNDQAQIVMWLKRAARYFPYVEARLKAEGLPDDLKYLAVAESSLLTRVVSPAGASGPWQFIEPTGKRYGLRRDAYFDDRRNPERATSAAVAYLTDLHKLFGSWTLAMAAYNCGERRVQNELAEQGVKSYYDLWLPQETMRYVFRVMAIKIILANPEAYGYRLPPEQLYQPLPADPVTLNLARPLHLRNLAAATGATVRKLKELNPELSTYVIPSGHNSLKVPVGQAAGLMERLAQLPALAEPAPPQATPHHAEVKTAQTKPAPNGNGGHKAAPRTVVVKPGQSLSGIAKEAGTTVEAIKKANNLGNGPLKAGQKLVVPGRL
jgi:membrane-bound lytic murein transglycosylase D